MADEQKKSKFAEQVEACRPDSDDLRAAEFATAAELIASDAAARGYYVRVQRSDARVAMAFRDVPVPAGLAERLLAAIDAAQPAPAASEETARQEMAPAVELRPAAKTRRVAMRFAIAASLVGLVVGGLALISRFTPYSNQQCLAEASHASAQLKANRWANIRTTAAPAARLPKTRLLGTVKSWQTATLLGDEQAVAYRFSNGATLLVCRPSKAVATLPIAPPGTPQQKAATSAGTHVAAWTSGGLVHVLMVSGPIEEYRRMTGATRPVVAQARPQSLPNRYNG